jgi:Peptidase family M23
MGRRLFVLLATLATGSQIARAEVLVDIEPKLPGSTMVVHYLHVAPKTATDPEQFRVCLRLGLANNGASAVLLKKVTVAIGSSFTEDITINGSAGLTLSPGVAPITISLNTDQCALLTPPAPSGGALTLSFGDGSTQITDFALKQHHGPLYAFPGRAEERPRGEFWQANSVKHPPGLEGSQLFAYDMAVVGMDPKTNTWSECHAGLICDPKHNPALQNAQYRIWGTKVYAMANGRVMEFMNDVKTNETVGEHNKGLCGVQGAGNHFYIDHDGEIVLYAHMQPGTLTKSLLQAGAKVTKGDLLGLAGNAGTASNPHLHIHAMVGQLRIAPGKNADGVDETCLREVPPLLLRPLPFSDTSALDRSMVDPVNFTGPWVTLDHMGPPSVWSLIISGWPATVTRPLDVVQLAIDPWALILPPKWYVFWVELRHPHEPTIADIQALLRAMPPDEQKATLDRARALGKYGKAVEEASASLQK